MGYKSAADTLESFQYDVINYMQFSQKHWRKIRTTNIMERTTGRLKEEVR